MATFQEVENTVAQLLPDNNSEEISPKDIRDVFQAVIDKVRETIADYMRVTLNDQATFQHDDLKVATNRLMIIHGKTVLSNGPVNDGEGEPGDWPFAGGATPNSWGHDPVTGDLWLPGELTGTMEITIRPDAQ